MMQLRSTDESKHCKGDNQISQRERGETSKIGQSQTVYYTRKDPEERKFLTALLARQAAAGGDLTHTHTATEEKFIDTIGIFFREVDLERLVDLK